MSDLTYCWQITGLGHFERDPGEAFVNTLISRCLEQGLRTFAPMSLGGLIDVSMWSACMPCHKSSLSKLLPLTQGLADLRYRPDEGFSASFMKACMDQMPGADAQVTRSKVQGGVQFSCLSLPRCVCSTWRRFFHRFPTCRCRSSSGSGGS
jgi:hypothetical protein